MQSVARRSHRGHVSVDDGRDADIPSLLARSCLTFYNTPPASECTLTEFEQSAFDRLTVLKHIDNARARRSINKQPLSSASSEPDDLRTHLTKADLLTNAHKDRLSHFVLRLAYCRTEDTRRWLISTECALFKYRFENETNQSVIQRFLSLNGLSYQPIEENLAAHVELLAKLRAIRSADSQTNPVTANTVFYRVPFEEAFDLVRERRVYLQAGWAYIPRANLVHIVVNKYRAHLSQQLAATFRFLQSGTSAASSDERVTPLLSSLAKQSLGPQYKAVNIEGQVTKEQLPQLAVSPSFPLCMSSLYSGLKQEHHLKHGGRMQLGLFLKDIGLSLSDALAFWKQSFSRRTPADKFEKEYAYNIRHNYGKEGKRQNYTAYSCMKIIQSQPSSTDHHGCPFRHAKQDDLRRMLAARNVAKEGTEEIMRLVKSSDYQIACTRLFTLTHGGVDPLMPVSHPNKYFDDSRKLITGERKVEQKDASRVSMTQPLPVPVQVHGQGQWAVGDAGPDVGVSVSQPQLVGERGGAGGVGTENDGMVVDDSKEEEAAVDEEEKSIDEAKMQEIEREFEEKQQNEREQKEEKVQEADDVEIEATPTEEVMVD